jgi:hypothetical protein
MGAAGSCKLTACPVIIFVLILVGRASNNAMDKTNADLVDIDKQLYLGHTYKLIIPLHGICPKPDLLGFSNPGCVTANANDSVSVIDIVAADGEIFAKVRLSDDNEGYIPEKQLEIVDKFSHPSPKIGMSADQALETNWGTPEKKNVTVMAGHRSEQWVFPDRGYLYIEDGVLRTIQRTEQ